MPNRSPLASAPVLATARQSCSCCSTASTGLQIGRRAPRDGNVQEFGVLGLTCGGCAARVTRRLMDLEGVTEAAVTALVAGGVSRVRVRNSVPLSRADVADAIARDGYGLAQEAAPSPAEGGAR